MRQANVSVSGVQLRLSYIQLYEFWFYVTFFIVLLGAIRKQLAAFLEGFYEIIPKRLISIFTEQELELLISGLPTIDIDDLKSNTEYHKYQSNSIQVSCCCWQRYSCIFFYTSSAGL